jgi:two-component system, NarL family, sensor kinase
MTDGTRNTARVTGDSKRVLERTPTRRALIQFAVSGLAALVIIGAIALFALRRESTQQSIREARTLTAFIATSIAQPMLQERPEMLTGDPAAVKWFDERIRARVIGDGKSIVRVKIWDPDGRIVYSDEAALRGMRFPLGPDETEALTANEPVAEVSDLSRPENVYERHEGKLLEVYLPIKSPNGESLLFETYRRFSTISADSSSVLGKFLPIFLLALLVLALVQAPLAWSMVRRLRDGQREREKLLLSAIVASDRERRRIASEVHDGPVQELAGLSFALAGAADRAGKGDVQRSLYDAAAKTRGVMRQLRGLLVGIHPPSLHASGLSAALSDLMAPLAAKDIATTLNIATLPRLEPEAEGLLFRGAQEALRNVIEHSGAHSAAVRVTAETGAVRLEVRDDGRGFDHAEHERRRAEGHIGLDILRDLVTHAGGSMQIDSTPGQGTNVSIVVLIP